MTEERMFSMYHECPVKYWKYIYSCNRVSNLIKIYIVFFLFFFSLNVKDYDGGQWRYSLSSSQLGGVGNLVVLLVCLAVDRGLFLLSGGWTPLLPVCMGQQTCFPGLPYVARRRRLD